MLGQKDRGQPELFIAGSLRALLPDDHVLVRVDRVLDLSWLRAEVSDCYSSDKGRPGIDPEAAVRLMLAGFLLGVVHDRHLMREAQVNLAIRWFAGYALHEALPDHSSLTRIRQRWGVERFRQIFERTVHACIAAKIATGEVLHVDASLIRAAVSWESLAVRHVEAVARENGDAQVDELAKKESRQTGRFKKVCVTDPDASMATNGRNRRLEPAYKQHATVDDLRGVIVDVEVTTGETNEGQVIIERIDAAAATTGQEVKTVTADAGYAYGKVYGDLERRGIDPVIPAKAEPIRSAVGLPRVRVGWKLSHLVRRTFDRNFAIIADELHQARVAEVALGPEFEGATAWPDTLDPEGTWHHMGTTRMHNSPRQGVVDRDCKIHGMDNLFVAGSSVFPTAGSNFPTQTIVALSIRLSEHIAERLKTRDFPSASTIARNPAPVSG